MPSERGVKKPLPEPTREQARMLKLLQAHNARYQRAQTNIDELWRERGELYLAARDLDPPLTFRAIAGCFGITEAAVMQMFYRVGGERTG